jgi:hypothetical protein
LGTLVLKSLRPKHRTTTLETEAGALYVEVLERSNDYLEQRTAGALKKLIRCASSDS